MKRRLLTGLLALAMLISLCACGAKEETPEDELPETPETVVVPEEEWLAAYVEILRAEMAQHGVSAMGIDVDGAESSGLCFGAVEDMDDSGVPELILVRHDASNDGYDKTLGIWTYAEGAAKHTVNEQLMPWNHIEESVGLYTVDGKTQFVHYRHWAGSANPGHRYTLVDIDGAMVHMEYADEEAVALLADVPDMPREPYASYREGDGEWTALTEAEFLQRFDGVPLYEFGVSAEQISDFIAEMNQRAQELLGEAIEAVVVDTAATEEAVRTAILQRLPQIGEHPVKMSTAQAEGFLRLLEARKAELAPMELFAAIINTGDDTPLLWLYTLEDWEGYPVRYDPQIWTWDGTKTVQFQPHNDPSLLGYFQNANSGDCFVYSGEHMGGALDNTVSLIYPVTKGKLSRDYSESFYEIVVNEGMTDVSQLREWAYYGIGNRNFPLDYEALYAYVMQNPGMWVYQCHNGQFSTESGYYEQMALLDEDNINLLSLKQHDMSSEATGKWESATVIMNILRDYIA